MDAFGKAFSAMKSRPWQVLGLSLMFGIGMFVLILLVGLLVGLLGFSEIASLGNQFQNNIAMGIGIGSLIMQAINKLAEIPHPVYHNDKSGGVRAFSHVDAWNSRSMPLTKAQRSSSFYILRHISTYLWT